MFAARPLHPAKADISGSPSDVAEGPEAVIGAACPYDGFGAYVRTFSAHP